MSPTLGLRGWIGILVLSIVIGVGLRLYVEGMPWYWALVYWTLIMLPVELLRVDAIDRSRGHGRHHA